MNTPKFVHLVQLFDLRSRQTTIATDREKFGGDSTKIAWRETSYDFVENAGGRGAASIFLQNPGVGCTPDFWIVLTYIERIAEA